MQCRHNLYQLADLCVNAFFIQKYLPLSRDREKEFQALLSTDVNAFPSLRDIELVR